MGLNFGKYWSKMSVYSNQINQVLKRFPTGLLVNILKLGFFKVPFLKQCIIVCIQSASSRLIKVSRKFQ